MRVLGIETSCDETAAAVVENGSKLISNVVISQIDLHREFGGVVPEVASRSHLEVILAVIDKALTEANLNKAKDPWRQIDAIAVTQGPGLPGALLVGMLTAKTLALLKHKPLYPVNHVLAHVYANFITENLTHGRSSIIHHPLPSTLPRFPLLSLIVSGGHTQLVLLKNHFNYHILGQTQDDAIGEAFDKVAKILGLPYPGGPSIALCAKQGNSTEYSLPTAKLDNQYDFSFSGLKTAVLRLCQQLVGKDYHFPSYQISPLLSDKQRADIAASFQATAVNTLVEKTVAAYLEYTPKNVIIAGGVAANRLLRQQLTKQLPIAIEYAPPNLCTDNAAMIASLGFFSAKINKPAVLDKLDISPSLVM